MDELVSYLSKLSTGKIANTSELERLLAKCWDDFEGDRAELDAYKLINRIESPVWEPPKIRFKIERHGGTVLGSSRAEIQEWTLDLETRIAECSTLGHRQVRPMQVGLNVEPIANEIAGLILHGKLDGRLRWYPDGRVRVLIGKILPEGLAVRQTLAGRRKRFRTALTKQLKVAGWEICADNLFKPPEPRDNEP